MIKTIYLMIRRQKIPLVKLIFFIFTINFNLLSASDRIDMVNNKTETPSSPFSVLKEDLYSSNDKSLLITKQPINSEDTKELSAAKIRLLECNTGVSAEYTIKKEENWQYNDGTYIVLHNCLVSKGEELNPINMALISITSEEETIFKGWIFSKTPALSLPKIEDHFIYLTECRFK